VGALDHTGIEELRAAAHPLLARYDGDQVVLDCSALESLDGRAVQQLAATACRADGGSIHLIGLSASVLDALQRAGVDGRFAIHAEHPA
jgi:anti-anti-sigma factor